MKKEHEEVFYEHFLELLTMNDKELTAYFSVIIM